MKTELEIQEADEKEKRIEEERKVADKAACLEFHEATKEEWDRYKKVWNPAKKRWEKFSKPHFDNLRTRLAANEKAEFAALVEARKDWRECPKCGTLAARFQVFCQNEKCGVNLCLTIK